MSSTGDGVRKRTLSHNARGAVAGDWAHPFGRGICQDLKKYIYILHTQIYKLYTYSTHIHTYAHIHVYMYILFHIYLEKLLHVHMGTGTLESTCSL